MSLKLLQYALNDWREKGERKVLKRYFMEMGGNFNKYTETLSG